MIRWLASYPKSGNTWVRIFLWAYWNDDGTDKEVDLDRIPEISHSESRLKLYDELAGQSIASWNAARVASLRFAVQKSVAMQLKPHQVVKTHSARARIAEVPLIVPQWTERAIYLLRHPMDVVDSYADHCGLSIDQTIRLPDGNESTVESMALANPVAPNNAIRRWLVSNLVRGVSPRRLAEMSREHGVDADEMEVELDFALRHPYVLGALDAIAEKQAPIPTPERSTNNRQSVC
ncbi:sulfotransferase domain-containing protein [Rhodopirellula sp. P2]|uniref:sulfotransferase domain-containing protein n=1 Tax=Rhodopirellula sp. P2 TaxID=2127060 RepID=UPI002368B3E5|nr:sulfotransferase domain-containing protein [Rhodopirellula sp. P2]WDQ19095.1 hypothetical protein PSR62_11270 [Rhodopirellula sp. P2]